MPFFHVLRFAEPKAPSPPPAKKLKPSSKSKKSADEVPSSTPAGAEKRKSKVRLLLPVCLPDKRGQR